MKHYNRARSGIGPYADLAGNRLPDAGKVAQLTFGPGWTPVEGSLRDKPNRCLLSSGKLQIDMMWGPPRAFQSLIWAGLNASIDHAPDPAIVVITRQGERLTDGQVERHRELGRRVGVAVHHVSIGSTAIDGGV